MSRWAVVLAVVSALFLGMALGFMGGVVFSGHFFERGGPRVFWRHHGPGPRVPGGPGGPGELGMMPPARVILPWLRRELDLTPQQVEAIRGEIQASRRELSGVHDSLHVRVARHLTPEQRRRFVELVKRQFPGDHRGRGPHTIRILTGEEGDPK